MTGCTCEARRQRFWTLPQPPVEWSGCGQEPNQIQGACESRTSVSGSKADLWVQQGAPPGVEKNVTRLFEAWSICTWRGASSCDPRRIRAIKICRWPWKPGLTTKQVAISCRIQAIAAIIWLHYYKIFWMQLAVSIDQDFLRIICTLTPISAISLATTWTCHAKQVDYPPLVPCNIVLELQRPGWHMSMGRWWRPYPLRW